MVVTAKVFTCAKGEFLEWAKPGESFVTYPGPPRGSFWMMLLTASDEAALVNKTSVAQVLASGAVECANSGYARKQLDEIKLWDLPHASEPLPSNTVGWTRQAWPYGSFRAYRPFTMESYPGYNMVKFFNVTAGGPPVVSFLLYWEPAGSTSDATCKPFVIYRFPAPFTLSTTTPTFYFPKNLGWVATA